MVSYISLASVVVLALTLTVTVGAAVHDQPQADADLDGQAWVVDNESEYVVGANATLEAHSPEDKFVEWRVWDIWPEA